MPIVPQITPGAINLEVIFFFYGLAFFALGVLVLFMPKDKDLLGLADDLWLIGAFGLLHGLNEWVDLFILLGEPFDVRVLKIFGALLLPASFVFLVLFGARTFFRDSALKKYVPYYWIAGLIAWAVSLFLSRGILTPGIIARYFLCIPGTWLTGAGLLRHLLNTDKKDLPWLVIAGALSSALAFFVYGILSGLIVPPADFFPASRIHYDSFLAGTGMPVQFFRMICAILLTVSFFGMIGIYSSVDRKIHLRGGLKRKITLAICAFSSVAVFLSIGVVFGWVHKFMIQTLGNHQLEVTQVLSRHLTQVLNEEIEELKVHLNSPMWEEAIEKANQQYASMPPAAIQDYLRERDGEWAVSEGPDSLVLNCLGSAMSARLKNLADDDRGVAEIFLTDRFGGLVAASEKTTDFYQADEDWWQKAVDTGTYIGAVELDQSSGALSVPFAVAIRDAEGRLIGVCKEYMEPEIFFLSLKSYRFGKTGHAALIDGEGNVIFDEKFKPLSKKKFDGNRMRELNAGGRKWFYTVEQIGPEKKTTFNSAERLEDPELLRNGVIWYVVVSQEAREVLAPLTAIEIMIPIFSFAVILLMIPFGLWIGRRFEKPIGELSRATEKIMRGDWNCEIAIKTGDEIEDLGDAFREMKTRLKELYDNLEGNVREKTGELTAKVRELEDTKLAVLNVIDDLSFEKEKLENSEKKLRESALDLKRSNQELEQFAYIASHDLQEPLRMVASYVQLLARRYKGKLDSDADEFIAFAVEGATRMQNLINDLLDYSRVGTRGTPLVPTDCSVVLWWALEHLKIKIEETGALITSDPMPEISADATQLLQLFQNLLANAIKFRRPQEPPRIHVAVKDMGYECLFTVSDNGIGFEAQYADKIFGIFQRLHGRDEYPGSGIGLAVCKKIVERHGGSIWAESVPGAGSKFNFIIPKKGKSGI